MVCDKCEKKLGKVITPDPWKAGGKIPTYSCYIYFNLFYNIT